MPCCMSNVSFLSGIYALIVNWQYQFPAFVLVDQLAVPTYCLSLHLLCVHDIIANEKLSITELILKLYLFNKSAQL